MVSFIAVSKVNKMSAKKTADAVKDKIGYAL